MNKSFFLVIGLGLLLLAGSLYLGNPKYNGYHRPEQFVQTKWALVNIVSANSEVDTLISYFPETIKIKGEVTQVEEMNDFIKVKRGLAHEYPSIKFIKEYNCNSKEFRVISFTAFSKKNGEGEVISNSGDVKTWGPGVWKPIEPDSPEMIFIPILCQKKK